MLLPMAMAWLATWAPSTKYVITVGVQFNAIPVGGVDTSRTDVQGICAAGVRVQCCGGTEIESFPGSRHESLPKACRLVQSTIESRNELK